VTIGQSAQLKACMFSGHTRKEFVMSWFETEAETRDYLEGWLNWHANEYSERGW
jgi:hypothetical protein